MGTTNLVSISNTTFIYNSAVPISISSNYVMSTVSISNSSFLYNQAQAISITSNLNIIDIKNTIFEGNNHNRIGTVALNGDIVRTINVTGCSWYQNTAQSAGGLYLYGLSNDIYISGSTFIQNIVSGEAAGIFISGGSTNTLVDSCQFNGNVAQVGGGISFDSRVPAFVTILHTNFTANTAPQGCAVAFRTTSPVKNMTLLDVGMYNNIGQRGAVYLPNNATTVISYSVFEGNTGSAVYGDLISGSIDIIGAQFIQNTANQGGSISLYGTANTVTITDSMFSESIASTVGADISVELNLRELRISRSKFTMSDASLRGGAVSVGATAKLQIFIMEDTTIEATTSLFGPGISIAGTCVNMTIYNCNFTNNIAQYEGAALYTVDKSVQNIDVRNCEFLYNSAISGSGLKISGGNTTDIYMYNNTFYSNMATNGAAVMLQRTVRSIVMDTCIYTLNSASSGGTHSILFLIVQINDDINRCHLYHSEHHKRSVYL